MGPTSITPGGMGSSRRLVEEKGFSFVAVEGDWPACYRVNRFVNGYLYSGASAREVLHNI